MLWVIGMKYSNLRICCGVHNVDDRIYAISRIVTWTNWVEWKTIFSYWEREIENDSILGVPVYDTFLPATSDNDHHHIKEIMFPKRLQKGLKVSSDMITNE